jgi:hypothetical protein
MLASRHQVQSQMSIYDIRGRLTDILAHLSKSFIRYPLLINIAAFLHNHPLTSEIALIRQHTIITAIHNLRDFISGRAFSCLQNMEFSYQNVN